MVFILEYRQKMLFLFFCTWPLDIFILTNEILIRNCLNFISDFNVDTLKKCRFISYLSLICLAALEQIREKKKAVSAFHASFNGSDMQEKLGPFPGID